MLLCDERFSNLKFFIPNTKFFSWLKKYKTKKIFDCGAGVGHVAAEAKDHGINIISIDNVLRENPESNILPIDCEKYEYSLGSVLLFCRPCHSGFVERIYEKFEGKVTIFYVGLESNLSIDLIKYPYTLIEEGIGQQRENVYLIGNEYVSPDAETYYLVEYIHGNYPMKNWLKSEYNHWGSCWINFNGGGFPRRDTDTVIKKMTVGCTSELDWTHIQEKYKDSLDGWLSPDGKFHGCRYSEHDWYATYVLGESTWELEREGWVRCHSKNYTDNLLHAQWVKDPTPKQRQFLNKNGYCEPSDFLLSGIK